MLVASNSVLAF